MWYLKSRLRTPKRARKYFTNIGDKLVRKSNKITLKRTHKFTLEFGKYKIYDIKFKIPLGFSCNIELYQTKITFMRSEVAFSLSVILDFSFVKQFSNRLIRCTLKSSFL
jgi:hypothetical protein